MHNKLLRTLQLGLEAVDEVRGNSVSTALLYSTVILRPTRGLGGKIKRAGQNHVALTSDGEKLGLGEHGRLWTAPPPPFHAALPRIISNTYIFVDVIGGLVVSILATGTRVHRFKPGRRRWIFRAFGISSVCLPSEGK